MVALLILVGTLASAGAQTKPPQGGEPPTIPPEKRELIRELVVVTKVSENAEKSAVILLDQFASQLPGMLSQILGDSAGLTGKDREEFDKALAESSARVLKRMKELLPSRVSFAEVVDQIFYPIYDKYFTEPELRDLVAFYKSPTGQKSIQVMPNLFQEALGKSADLLNAKLTALVREVLDEEKQRLLKK
jgi:hypothetical protein